MGHLRWGTALTRAVGILLVLAAVGTAQARTFDFEVIAGGAVGDGGPATQANLNGVSGLAFDAQGNLYISQGWGNRIRKVSAATGVITTIAGGRTGFGGDGGPASAALINQPRGLAFDAAGNLYFVDAGNVRVRRIATDGTISTVVGNGTRWYAGDGGPATEAGFAEPYDLAFDGAGNLYVSDWINNRVRKVSGGVITTVAGNGTRGYVGDNGPAGNANLSAPQGIDIDATGNLYIADSGNDAVRKVATDGTITTYTQMAGSAPYNVLIGPDGVIYLQDNGQCKISKGPYPLVGGGGCGFNGDGGPAAWAAFGEAEAMVLDAAGNFFFADSLNQRVRRVAASDGKISTFAGNGSPVVEYGPALGAALTQGGGISVGPDGRIVFADAMLARKIRAIEGGKIKTLAGSGAVSNSGCDAIECPAEYVEFRFLRGVTHLANGDVLVGDYGWDRIYRLDAAGVAHLWAGWDTSTTTDGVGDGLSARFAIMDPRSIAADLPGTGVYIADYAHHRIRYIDAEGVISTIAGTGTSGVEGEYVAATNTPASFPNAIAVDPAGNVYFNEGSNRRIRIINHDGIVATFAGTGYAGMSNDGGSALHAELGRVTSLAADRSGLYMAAEGTLRRIDMDGIIDTIHGLPGYAMGLTIRDHVLYVTTADGRVLRAAIESIDHDYDGDGKADLLWRNTQTGGVVAWRAADGANSMDVMDVNNLAWKIVGQGDFDGDLKSDIIWRNDQTGSNAIWRSSNYATQFPVVGVNNLAWSVAGVGDFDGDNRSDLLWRNGANGQNAIWRAATAATQLPATAVTNLQWKIVGVGDFDGDRHSDILWRNTTTGINAIWRSGNSATQLPITGVTNPAWKIQGVGDFDGDGKSDIFWRNTANGINAIWRSGNSATQLPVVGVTSQLWRVVAVGDYDEDGKSDLVWRNTGNGTNTVWRSGDAATQIPVTGVTNQAWSIVPYTNQR